MRGRALATLGAFALAVPVPAAGENGDLRLEPPREGEPLNFFVHPYVERDGEPVDGVEGRYSVRRLPAGGEAARLDRDAAAGRVVSRPR